MDEAIKQLQAEMNSLTAEIAQQQQERKLERERAGIKYQIDQMAPEASAIIKELAVAKLPGKDGPITERVSRFLANPEVAPFLGSAKQEQASKQPAQQQTQQPGKRPSLADMMSDLGSGNAQFRM